MTYKCLVCQSSNGTPAANKGDQKEDWYWTVIETPFGRQRQFGPFCKEDHAREFQNAAPHRQAWFLTRDNATTEAFLRLKKQHDEDQQPGMYIPQYQAMFLYRNPSIDEVRHDYDLGPVEGVATDPEAMLRLRFEVVDLIESDGEIEMVLE